MRWMWDCAGLALPRFQCQIQFEPEAETEQADWKGVPCSVAELNRLFLSDQAMEKEIEIRLVFTQRESNG
jgi:hypothetical protein